MGTLQHPSASNLSASVNPRGASQRAVSLPIKLTNGTGPRRSSNHTESEGVEILFSHDSGKVVAFSPPGQTSQLGSRSSSQNQESGEEKAGILPWSSRTERTICAGRLQLYRAHSVAFLSAGRIVHPILAKSQCWCVDGETKFVLRIRGNAYYRIELPNNDEEDRRKAEALKDVLSGILLYEKTACPFQRGFTVELPERPKTPVQKRPWTPRQVPTSSEMSTPESPGVYLSTFSYFNRRPSSAERPAEIANPKHVISASPRIGLTCGELLRSPTRPKAIVGPHSIVIPPRPVREPPQSTSTATSEDVRNNSSSDLSRISSSEESFHTVHSRASNSETSAPNTSQPSSPPSSPSSDGYQLAMPHLPPQEHDPSRISPPPNSPRRWNLHETPSSSDDDAESSTAPPATPGLMSDIDDNNDEEGSEAVTPASRPYQWKRNKGAGPPTLSPPSSRPSLLFPASSTGHRLTKAIVRTTCLLMFSTPAQLIDLMVSIARKVVNGMLGGVVIGINEEGQRIPCEWDFSDDDEGDHHIWDEDGYGIQLSDMTKHGSIIRKRDVGEAWELD